MAGQSSTDLFVPPQWRTLPSGRTFSPQFLELREQVFHWMADYYDLDHLTRAGDWMLALEPDAPEHLILAALTHDLERLVPGGPVLDRAVMDWDDREYNRAHCDRSAEVVSAWLAEHGAPESFVEGVRQPIREHEFGGSPEGDLMQAADSISFLEATAVLVANRIIAGHCSYEKGIAKLRWMCERVRLDRAREHARWFFDDALADVARRIAESEQVRASGWAVAATPTTEGLVGTSRHVEANGIRLHFLEYGSPEDPALVIVPGITSPAATWEFVAVELAREYHVLTMDVRGRGLSDQPRAGFTTPDYARDVAESLAGLGLERPLVLGHSMGARIAAAFGAMYPDLRGPLIVADPPTRRPADPPTRRPADHRFRWPAVLDPGRIVLALDRRGQGGRDGG